MKDACARAQLHLHCYTQLKNSLALVIMALLLAKGSLEEAGHGLISKSPFFQKSKNARW